jgi:methionyl-tRNA formyltransferase
MDIAFFGRGPVANRCLEVLNEMPTVSVTRGAFPKGDCDFLVSVHWPAIFKGDALKRPLHGAVNVHNSYLPWNRGAHACTWAILNNTPHGATMHWMNTGVDTGDILIQERLEIDPADTADSLYQKTADLEVKVFRAGMELLLKGLHIKKPQAQYGGVTHKKRDFERLVRAVSTSDCKVTREA